MAEQQSTGPQRAARRRVRKQGLVTSDRMNKTIAVRVDHLLKHPLYGKYVKRRSTLKAHDSGNVARIGDLVEIEFTRPLSATKRWKLVRVVKQGPAALAGMARGAAAIELRDPETGTGGGET